MSDVVSVVLFFGVAVVGWTLMVLGVIRTVRRCRTRGLAPAAVAAVATLAGIGLLIGGRLLFGLYLVVQRAARLRRGTPSSPSTSIGA
jgi:hypothetical protein